MSSSQPRSPRAASPGRRERAKADKRARILAAAERLFNEHGYEGTQMSEVARLADVAGGTVFQYAASKPELLMMVTASLWRRQEEQPHALSSTSAATSTERILELISPLVRAMRRWPEPTTWVAREILFGAEGTHRHEVLGFVERLEARIAAILAGADADTSQVARAAAGARLIVSGVLVELNLSLQGRATAATIEERLHDTVAIVVAGTQGCSAAATRHLPDR